MGTKPMVFPLDGSGNLYALFDESDLQICTGSRETCYRLLARLLREKNSLTEKQALAADAPEMAFQSAGRIPLR